MNNGFYGKFWANVKVVTVAKVVISIAVFVLSLRCSYTYINMQIIIETHTFISHMSYLVV